MPERHINRGRSLSDSSDLGSEEIHISQSQQTCPTDAPLPIQDQIPEPNPCLYSNTANPQDHNNISLHIHRYRKGEKFASQHDAQEVISLVDKQRIRFRTLYDKTDFTQTHYHLEELNVSKFHMDPVAQRWIYDLQTQLVDIPYNEFGKTEGSWNRYTLMFRNGWSPGDRRKPITDVFQQYCENIYCPVMFAMLFGSAWQQLKQHWSTFKSCTIKVCESDTSFYGKPVYHMHIDGKIGLLERRNFSQQHMSRMLFSIVTDTLNDMDNKSQYKYGTTVYPIWQPRKAFKNNHQFHEYMQSWYRECGLENSGLPRPHYEIPPDLTYRATTGEVLIHFTHADDKTGPQAIHSEPNPCPDRHLYVFDWVNIIRRDKNGKHLPSIEVPEKDIVKNMLPLEDSRAEPFRERLNCVLKTAQGLMDKADEYPSGRSSLVQFVQQLTVWLEK